MEKSCRQHVEGSPGSIWESKLRNTKWAIKEWVKINYKEPERIKKEIKNTINNVQKEIEEQGLTQERKMLESKLYSHLCRVNIEEESKWRIKSRQLWLQEGDQNTTFFHKQTTVRRVSNTVSSILDTEGNLQTAQEAIRQVATNHYRDLLTETTNEEDYDDLLQFLPKSIRKEMNDTLNKEIDEEEVRKTIWDLQPDKTPGPDGFPICFYHAFWGIIKRDLIKMLKWVQWKAKIGGYTNATHLALIPKEN